MKKAFLFLLIALGLNCGLQACVTYNPSDGTYTVDSSGCVKSPK